jgi:homocysteine S-methyltransferase
MGLRNLLITTGDPQRLGEFLDATPTFDVDSIGLTNVVSRLNHGSDIGGQPVVPPTAFHIGVAVNPSALNLDEELRRFHYKVEAGAEFVVTHPVFDLADLEHFLQRAGGVTLPVIASVRPLDSERQAEALANEVPGVRVPAAYVQRLARADEAGHGVQEGLAIARDIVTSLRPLVQGIQVAVPPSRLASAGDVLAALDE